MVDPDPASTWGASSAYKVAWNAAYGSGQFVLGYRNISLGSDLLPYAPVSVGSFGTASPTARTATGTCRSPFFIVCDATDLRLVLFHHFNSGVSALLDTNPASDLVGVKASLELGGVIYPLTVAGQRTFTIAAGGQVETDPLSVEVTAGTVAWVRTFIPAGQTWYSNKFTGSSGTTGGAGGFTTTTDLTNTGAAAVADSAFSVLWTAATILGVQLDGRRPSVLIAGDSVGHGAAEMGGNIGFIGINTAVPNVAGGGYLMRALRAVNIPAVNIANPGDVAAIFKTTAGHWKRESFAKYASTVICQYGRNDVSSTDTLDVIQASLMATWQLFYRRRMEVLQTTITPGGGTVTTDGYWTVANQTASPNNGKRVLLNAWLRDGAPIDATTLIAVATGTTGALRAGTAGHPLAGIIDATDAVETARDSGIWVAPTNARTVADAAQTSGQSVVTSATAAFTSADLGRRISVAGAGAAGITLHTQIFNVNNATSVTVIDQAGTTVTGTTAQIGDDITRDGTHPGPAGHARLQAAANLRLLI
jgi:hypothetical protein